MSKIAVIRIRGNTGVKKQISDTMDMLRLKNQHNCIVIEDTPELMGMVKKVQHFVTYGPVSDESIALLEPRKKGTVYFLHPPRSGFERKGIKVPFVKGGALGKRDSMDSLIAKMV